MKSVEIVEVGLRDGLQNEKEILSVANRVEFAQKLLSSGVKRLELGAFVRADRIPQMQGSAEVIEGVMQGSFRKSPIFSALVPNMIGLEQALQTPIKEIAVFAACSESFSLRNINCTIEESFKRFEPVIKMARERKLKIRGYLSTCFGCPFEGKVSEDKVVRLAQRLIDMGCFEVSIGDTIGVAHPRQVESLVRKLKKKIPVKKIACHFHDTRGTALVNIKTAYDLGVRVFDSSLGGLGGCPYAPGSAGNVATEDVVYMFSGMKVKTGLKLEKLIETNRWVSEKMGKTLPSKVGKVGLLQPLGQVKNV